MKKFVAFFIDIGISFVLFGYIIALLTGQTTDGGFQLEGTPALVLFALIIVYFVAGKKLWGQSLGRKIMKVEPKVKNTPQAEMAQPAETVPPQPTMESTQPMDQEPTPQV